uniref:Putative secreted protein n=1 Tax=Anopheles darlingi TaxID=43151 RepID=A0A2M4DBS1_ANODA
MSGRLRCGAFDVLLLVLFCSTSDPNPVADASSVEVPVGVLGTPLPETLFAALPLTEGTSVSSGFVSFTIPSRPRRSFLISCFRRQQRHERSAVTMLTITITDIVYTQMDS